MRLERDASAGEILKQNGRSHDPPSFTASGLLFG